MISNAQLTPVLPVADVSRAAGFYRDRLGLKDAGEDPAGNHLVQTGSGTLIALFTIEQLVNGCRKGFDHPEPTDELLAITPILTVPWSERRP